MSSSEPVKSETAETRFTVRELGEQDGPAMRALFRKVFREEMTETHWHWKYGRKDSRATGVFQGSELVGHYGGVGLDVLLEGKAEKAIQITDLMVDPAVRHVARYQSPFYLATSRFLHDFVGYNKPFLLAYGFPSDRAMTLSEKLGLYKTVGKMCEVIWPESTPGNSALKFRKLDADNFAAAAPLIDDLWEKIKARFNRQFTVIKNADYFRWRFLEHPSRTYEIYLIQAGLFRKTTGLVVIKPEGHQNVVMEVLSIHDLETGIAQARQIAARSSVLPIKTWCPESCIPLLQIKDARINNLPIRIPANTSSPGPDPEWQQDKWCLFPGDTDYL